MRKTLGCKLESKAMDQPCRIWRGRASRWPRRAAMIVGLFTVLVGGDCDSSGPPTTRDRADIAITLRNSDALPVHLFAPGETFPCCQIAPGGTRPLTLNLGNGDDVTFAAGRNEQLIASGRCVLGSTGFLARAAEVSFQGSTVRCVGWE